MACCINVSCFFCALCICIGLASLIQFCLGIYLNFIETDYADINRLVKTDQFDAYLLYILIVFLGLGLISLILSFFSVYSTIRRLRLLSFFVAILWVFIAILNIVMLIVSVLYYVAVLPRLQPLLTHTLDKLPSTTLSLVHNIESKYSCCGINGKDDYKQYQIDLLPESCCSPQSDCFNSTEINDHQNSNDTTSFINTNGCFRFINTHVTMELWMFMGVAGSCAFLQILAVMLVCTLYQRYRKFDDYPKFVINRIGTGKSIDDSNDNIQGSSKTIAETVEITQI